MQAILGIDIAKATFHAALLSADSSATKSFPNNAKGFIQLDHWLRNRKVDRAHACMEATGSYGEALAVHLVDAGHTVSIVNPARIKGFAISELQRNKTDDIDAGVIARFCKALQPPAWIPPPPAVRELQALVRRRQNLQATRQRELNRRQIPGLPPSVERSVEGLVKFLDAEIDQLEELIRKHTRPQANAGPLRSAPTPAAARSEHTLDCLAASG